MSEEEIIEILKDTISLFNNDTHCLARSDDERVKAIQGLLDLYNKEKEKNKKLEEQLRKTNEYIRNEMYIDENPTICGNEEDTITELPISLNLYNEDLRKLLELLKEK